MGVVSSDAVVSCLGSDGGRMPPRNLFHASLISICDAILTQSPLSLKHISHQCFLTTHVFPYHSLSLFFLITAIKEGEKSKKGEERR